MAEQGRGIALIEAKTGARIQQFTTTPRQRREAFHHGLAMSPDGRRLAVGGLGDCGIAIYDLRDGSPLIEWEASETDLLEFSSDGRRLLQSCHTNNELCLWEAATGRLLWSLKRFAPAVLDPSGEQIIAAHGNELVLLDAANGSTLLHLARFRGSIHVLVVRRDGRMVICGDTEGFVHGQFDTLTRASLPRLEDDRPILQVNDVQWLDGTRVIGAVIAHRWRGTPQSEEQLVL